MIRVSILNHLGQTIAEDTFSDRALADTWVEERRRVDLTGCCATYDHDLETREPADEIVNYYRVFASRNNGNIVKSVAVLEDGINAAHDELQAIPGVDLTELSGPFRGKLPVTT